MQEASVTMVTEGGVQTDEAEEEDPSQLVDKLSLIGKIVIDKQVWPPSQVIGSHRQTGMAS